MTPLTVMVKKIDDDEIKWIYSRKKNDSRDQENHNKKNENLNFKSSSNKLNRSLFGQSDPLETKRLLYEQMNSRRIIDRNRWNFDFHTEKPLQGRYEWHKLTRSDTSPPQSPFDRRTPSPKFFSNHYQDGK